MHETLIQVSEAVMLICFGISWPIDILNTLRLRRASGKSLLFMGLIILGYMAGVVTKILRCQSGDQSLEPVTWLYVFNALLVAIDLIVSYYYQRKEAASACRT